MGEETQYRLQCDIINVAPVQHLTVSWYKNNESIKTQSFNDTTKTPVNESSVLRVTISREENEVQFRCEAQLDFGPDVPQLPVISQTHSVSAHYAPELNTTNNPHDISTLEGTDITLSCEAEGNPPPVYHWTCDGVNQLENTNSLSITGVNHNVTCTCTATNDLGNITKTIHVHVKERGCPLTLTPSEIVVRFGDPVSINCSTSATYVVGMGWEAPFGGTGFEPPPAVTWSTEKVEEWTPSPSCYATLDDNSQCSMIPVITVYKGPDTVSISELDHSLIVEATAYKQYTRTQYRLQCDIINVAPVQHLTVSWYKNNESIMTQSFNDTTKTPVNESFVLRVTISREENEVQFRCEAQLDFASYGPQLPVISQPYSISAHYAPELNTKNNPHDISTLEGTNITLSCEAEGNPPPVYHWTCDGVNQLENTNSLSITGVNHNVTCTCTATNDLGNITKTIHVHVKERGCPLTLTPSEIVVRFGDPVSINCSTSATYVVGMGWEAPFGGTGFEPPPAVTWSTEKVEEWTPSPSCSATLDDHSQCSISPVITVYKGPDTVSIPELDHSLIVEATAYKQYTRTQYRLQCDIINVAPVQHLTVSWYKNNESIMTQSFNDTTKTPVNESSVLRVTISREENEVQFRCEAQLDFGSYGPQLPVISQPYSISAHYAPELNTKNNPHDISTLEGTNITLSCEAEGNPPPVYHWTCDGVNQLENTNSLSITGVNHNVTCTCTATNDLGNITKTIHVHVKERGCPLTLTPSEIVVRFGDPVSINCSTSATYVVGMGWEAPFGGTGFEPPPAVTWSTEKVEEWTPSPSCSATLDDHSQCSISPVITVYKGPDTVSISELDHSLIVEATAYKQYTRTQYRLQCDIINVAPVQHLTVSWYKNNESIMTQSFNDTTKTPVNESSVLRVTISREENEVQFRCEAQLDFGSYGPQLPVISQPYSISAHYAPELNTKNNPHDISTLEGTNITLSCEAEGNPPPVYHWTCDGVNQLENTNSLSITGVNHNVTCTCTATNDLGNITKTIHVHVKERGCPLTLTPSEIVVRFGDPVSINCSTSATYVVGMGWEAPFGGTGFEPPPAVTWSTEKVEEWTPSPSCSATLDDNSQCSISPVITVYNAPEFKEGNESREVLLGENVTLSCSADSNPPPNISWIYAAAGNSKETTEGRQRTVTITRATSVNAGVYICVGENKFGRKSRSVTLVVKGKTSYIPFPAIWVSLAVLLIILFLLVLLRHKRRNARGHYSFVPVRGPDIPLTTAQANGKFDSLASKLNIELGTELWTILKHASLLPSASFLLHAACWANMWPVRMLSFLMLILSLCDAGSTCTIEDSRLILHPRRIIEEYGGNPVSVNCTSEIDDHNGMYWTVGNESSPIEKEEPLISYSVPLSDWDVKAECKIKLTESYECSRKLKVILFKNPEVVLSAQHVNVMGEETQYRLQCDIINVAPVQHLTVSWYKNNESIMTQSFNDTTKTPVNESSVLRVTISREENEVQFRCEAQLDFGPDVPQLPVISQTHSVSAHYAPELNTTNNPHDISTLEGTNITLSCEAEGNPPPVYHWTCDGVNQLENTNSLSITGVNHNVTCTCTATNDLGNITKTIHVHVKERGCPLTLTPSEIVVRFGDPVSINCSTSATYVVGMGWEAPFGGTGFEPPPAVTWSTEKVEEWTPSPSCSATLDDHSQCSISPVITVYKGPDTVSIPELDHSLIVEATAYKQYTRTQYRLQCDIINVAPVQHLTVSWYKNNESIMTQSFNDTTKTPVNESSVLRVTISREENEVQFRCEAQLDFGSYGPQLPVISQTYSISAHYAPELNTKNSPHDISTLEGTDITLSCEAEGNPPPVYHWTCDGVNQLENTNSLSITGVNHNVTCTCTATNDLGNITKTIHVHVKERGCPLTLTPSEIVVRFGDPVSINCSTSATYVVGMGWEAPFGGTGFEPPPAVTWRVEKVEEWTPSPSCYATLDDNSQCSMIPVITVYKDPDTVSIPELDHSLIVEATAYKQYTRTQHRLKCDIINVAPVQHLTVSWYKNNESIMTQSFNDTTKTPVNESSVLRVTISREENEVQFRCEAQLDFASYGPQLPVISQPYSISAHYAPELNTENNPHDISTLEGTDITLSCEAEGNPPPVYHWTCDGVNQLENTNSLSITGVNHNVTCTCTATNDLGNITKTIHVHVKERGCPLTLTPSEIVVRFGDPVSINCSTSATYVVGMGWEAPFGGTGFEPPPAVTWRVEKVEEWTPSPSCYATLDDNSQCSMIPVITVYKPPDSVSVSAVDHSSILEGREYHLKCDINNVAPVQNLSVKWYKGKETAFTETFDEFSVTPVNKSSSLRVTAQRDHNGSVFRCEAELQLGPKGPELSPSVTSAPYTAVVLYAPEFKEGNESREVLLGENVTLSCSADSNPPAIIEWIYAAAGNSKETTEGRQRTVTITRATSVNAGVYVCVGENKFGRKARSVTLLVKGKTSYIPFPAIWVSLAVLLIILFLLVLLRHKRRNARGHYSFVPVRGPDIPLTTAQANGKA
ncbi:hemicentin-1-like [Archocentrus centrarchus]|uniref:hemicentin-1-like n=1 Tax=Archocentrus centrarchus TaxID=63155 RepID=UPI0011EA5111|nr:hemicentin-1-like [Archocentrus centrarchus]